MDAPETPAKPRLFSWRLPLVLAATALVFYVLWTYVADRDAILAALRAGDATLVGAAAALMGVALVLSTQRMRFMLRAMGYEIPFRTGFRAVMATWPFAVIAPSRLNELLRVIVLRQHIPIASGAGAIVAERVVDLQNLCILAVLGGLVLGQWPTTAAAVAGLAALWAGAVALAWRPDFFVQLPLLRRKADKLRQLVSGFEALRRNHAAFAGVTLCSLAVWANAIAMIWVLHLAFGAVLPVATVAALWPLAIFVGLLPLTLSGMGTRDAAFLSLLALSGVVVADELVLSATIMYAVVTTFLPAVVGIPWMIAEWGNFRKAWS